MNGGIVFSPTFLASCCGITAILVQKLNTVARKDEGIDLMPHFRQNVIQTIGEIRVAELQVLAGTSRVGLCAQWVLHLLDLQLKGVERAEDFFHAVVVVFVVGIHSSFVHHLASINVPTRSALHRSLDGEWVDDIARRALFMET